MDRVVPPRLRIPEQSNSEAARRWRLAYEGVKRQILHKKLTARSTSPAAFMNHVGFMVIIWLVVVRMLPITNIHETYMGIQNLTNNLVTFKHLGGAEGTLASVTTLDDVVLYTNSLVNTLLTHETYDEPASPGDDNMILRVHKLVNSILLVQRRVSPTDCAQDSVKRLYRKCYESLDVSEIKNGTYYLDPVGGSRQAVRYQKGLGGFAVELPLNKERAGFKFDQLKRGHFWDRATREFVISFTIHNAPGKFTGNVAITFDMSPYGYVTHAQNSQFIRLQPYAKGTGGLVNIVLQGMMFGWLCFTFLWFAYDHFSQPHIRWALAKFLRLWGLMEILSYIMFIQILMLWQAYMSDPGRKSFDFESDHYQDIMDLADKFNSAVYMMAFALLVWALRTVEFLGAFPSLKSSSKIFETVLVDLSNFFLLFAIVFVGFFLAGYILFGSTGEQFRTPERSAQTLMLWFVALSGGFSRLYDMRGGFVFVFLFIAILMVLLFNMFIAIVMGAHDEVMGASEDPWDTKPWNHRVADAICDTVGISQFNRDPYNRNSREKSYSWRTVMAGLVDTMRGTSSPVTSPRSAARLKSEVV